MYLPMKTYVVFAFLPVFATPIFACLDHFYKKDIFLTETCHLLLKNIHVPLKISVFQIFRLPSNRLATAESFKEKSKDYSYVAHLGLNMVLNSVELL